MRPSGALAVTVLAMTVVATTGVGARAMTEGSGELHDGRFSVGIEASRAGRPGQTDQGGLVEQVDSRSSALPALVRYRSTPLAAGQPGGLDGSPLCNAVAAPGVAWGWEYDVVGYAPDGTAVSDWHTCVPFPGANAPSSTPPPPPVLPVAPTVGDVWRAVALPPPVVGVNPVSRGVTGLDTRLWSGGPQTAQVAVTLGGVRVTGVARVIEYRFFTDDGYLGATTVPGDADHPAFAHRFTTKGAHTVSVASVWRANVTMVGLGTAAPVPIDIQVAVLTATVGYPVTEVRSRLVG